MEHLETTIRRHLVSYLAGNVSLDELTNWLVRATWNIENSENAAARELAYAVELALAEYSSGLLTPDELRAELRALSQQLHLDVASM
jgi:hypothetical protein